MTLPVIDVLSMDDADLGAVVREAHAGGMYVVALMPFLCPTCQKPVAARDLCPACGDDDAA